MAYSEMKVKGRPELLTFGTCPKCDKLRFEATDFVIKGNEPFFNLVSEQFYIQPPVPEYRGKANEGRKVFLKVAYQNGLRFFYGNNEEELLDALEKMGEMYEKKGDRIKYASVIKRHFDHIPDQYYEHLLRQLCSNFRSLTDAGLCWVEPCKSDEDDETFEEIEEDLEEAGIEMSLEEFRGLFAAWAMEIMTSQYAVGSKIDDDVRKNITMYPRLGIEDADKLPPRIKKMLEAHGFSKEQIGVITRILGRYLAQGVHTSSEYLNMNMITLRFGEDHEWYKCPRCSGVFPFILWGKCAHCGKGIPRIMGREDFKGINFWRAPVLEAVHGEPQAQMTRINTEEHTAQLSYKDQRHKTWSTTEDFEMRFQNVHVDNDRPVDILSCTTTMEVGIDIGSLTAVGLRNIPPRRENYQQRAGRAGRRSAAISTIVTYTDNRPHDSYYFHNPEKIISGVPRTPWIDVSNKKLAYRHLNIICATEFFDRMGTGADEESVCGFFQEDYDKFKDFIGGKMERDFDLETLIPEGVAFHIEEYKKDILGQMEHLKKSVEEFPEEYREEDGAEKSVLYAFLEGGIALADKLLKYALPKADEMIRAKIK